MISPDPTVEQNQLLKLLPIKNKILFPHAVMPFSISLETSAHFFESLEPGKTQIAVVAEINPDFHPNSDIHLYTVGTAAIVHTVMKTQQNSCLVIAEGFQRIRVVEIEDEESVLSVRVEPLEDVLPIETDPEYEALARNASVLFKEIVENTPHLSDELDGLIPSVDDPSGLTDSIAANLPFLSIKIQQELLETLDVRKRLRRIVDVLGNELEVLHLRNKIQEDVEESFGRKQREYVLREQLKSIQKELGEFETGSGDVGELRKKLEKTAISEEGKKAAEHELDRLEKIPHEATEYSMVRTYLDWLIELPWNKPSADQIDIKKAEKILDEDHYDLEKVKLRMLEYLAVFQLKNDLKGPILCFVGPPGVGKTSLGQSIARALGREFVRISLGGIHDEAEIRGHRRTYVGALPGQIIQGLHRAGTSDPVFMLDEVDKIGYDFRGDPAAALFEVLDPEQNNNFRDHYLDVPFDLSKVLFITTANILDTIPPALCDRMEVLELPGYTEEEKVHIAQQYLVPREIENHGLCKKKHIHFTKESIHKIIRNYTYEAGVRNLNREIANVCRKKAHLITKGEKERLEVTPEVVREKLGVPRFRIETELEERTQNPGVAVGLAWTPMGGEILFVEAAKILCTNNPSLTITGQVGEVMQESLQAAFTWVRGNYQLFDLKEDEIDQHDVHVHVPAGAIPKDGPSAGITMAIALASIFMEKAVKPYVGTTGEITLNGAVLPVGGIKEKVLAARRSGVKEMILPFKNKDKLEEDVPETLRKDMKFHFVKTITEALTFAFGDHESSPSPSSTIELGYVPHS